MKAIPQTLAALSVTGAVPLTALDGAGIIGIVVCPTDGAVALGDANVTAATGIPVNAGDRVTVETEHPSLWYVVAASGATNVQLTLLKGSR